MIKEIPRKRMETQHPGREASLSASACLRRLRIESEKGTYIAIPRQTVQECMYTTPCPIFFKKFIGVVLDADFNFGRYFLLDKGLTTYEAAKCPFRVNNKFLFLFFYGELPLYNAFTTVIILETNN